MSRYTISDLQTDVRRKLTTSNPSASLDFYGAILEAKRKMTKRIAPPEMVRENYLEQAIYARVNQYAVPDDLNYSNIIDIKKLHSYRDTNIDTLDHPFQSVYRRRFNQNRPGARNIFNVSYVNGLKTMSIKNTKDLRCQQYLIDNCDSLSKNGTWTVGGNLVNLIEDKLNYVEGKGALNFAFNSSSNTGSLEKTFTDTIDLKDYLQKGANFASLSIDLPKTLISVRFRLFSSDNDYYDFTVNAPHDSNLFRSGWQVLKFLFDNEYVVGNPNPSEIRKIRFDFVTTSTPVTNVRLDSIFCRKGEVYEITYQSSFCIIDASTKTWKLRPSQATDELPFEDDSYQIFMLETALVLQKELYANNAAGKADVEDIENELKEAYVEYESEHPSEVVNEEQTTYVFGTEYDGYQDDPMDYGYENRGDEYPRAEDYQ